MFMNKKRLLELAGVQLNEDKNPLLSSGGWHNSRSDEDILDQIEKMVYEGMGPGSSPEHILQQIKNLLAWRDNDET